MSELAAGVTYAMDGVSGAVGAGSSSAYIPSTGKVDMMPIPSSAATVDLGSARSGIGVGGRSCVELLGVYKCRFCT